MWELLSNPYYSMPLAILIGCAIGLGFCYFYYTPKLNLGEKRLRDKAQELYAVNHALEKSRYELVMLASEANEQDRISEKVQKILHDKTVEVSLLREEINILEQELNKRNKNIFNLRSDQKTQAKLAKIRSKQQQLLFTEGEVIELAEKRKIA